MFFLIFISFMIWIFVRAAKDDDDDWDPEGLYLRD